MTDGSQKEDWRTFYELGWGLRLAFLEQLLDGGEYSIPRCLGRLAQHERRYHYGLEADGTAHFVPKIPGNTPVLPTGEPACRSVAFNGQHHVLPSYTYSDLASVIVDFATVRGPFDAIIELGCGIGTRLFLSYYSGLPQGVPLFGGELTASGRAAASRLAALDPRIDVRFFPFDHLAPDLSLIRAAGFQKVLVYTCHSLEQVREVPVRFFAELAGCAPSVTALHLEPFGFQIDDHTPASRAQKKMFDEFGWNANLVAAAAAAEAAGLIRREWVSVNNFLSTDDVNQTSVMIWTNSPAGG